MRLVLYSDSFILPIYSEAVALCRMQGHSSTFGNDVRVVFQHFDNWHVSKVSYIEFSVVLTHPTDSYHVDPDIDVSPSPCLDAVGLAAPQLTCIAL